MKIRKEVWGKRGGETLGTTGVSCMEGGSLSDRFVMGFCEAWSGGGEVMSLGVDVDSELIPGFGAFRSKRSTGFKTSSKLELSSSWESALSLSAKLEAKLAIALPCSRIDGGGPRGACDNSLLGSGSCAVDDGGDVSFVDDEIFEVCLLSTGTSVGASPA